MERSRVLRIPSLTIKNARVNSEAAEDIDTGDIDGSGEIVVQAGLARQSGRNIVFENVVISATAKPGVTQGYPDFSDTDLTHEATSMLRRDYAR